MEIYCSTKSAQVYGPVLACSPRKGRRMSAASLLGGYRALSYQTLLPLLAGLADPDLEVYQTVVLAISRLHC